MSTDLCLVEEAWDRGLLPLHTGHPTFRQLFLWVMQGSLDGSMGLRQPGSGSEMH